jgi:Fe-S cluster biogenesis protein NfuA
MQEIEEEIDFKDIESRIQKVLAQNRQFLQEDGGDIEFVKLFYSLYKGQKVLKAEVRFLGECAKCPLSTMTLRAGIEKAIQEEVPEIFRIEEEHES